jgi:NADH-quinone oxidoreductase subunit K
MITLSHYLIVSTLLFVIGLVGVVSRRNALMILLSVELMFNAAALSFVAFSRYLGGLDGHVFVFFIITVAAAEVTVGLAIALLLSRRFHTLDAYKAELLKW